MNFVESMALNVQRSGLTMYPAQCAVLKIRKLRSTGTAKLKLEKHLRYLMSRGKKRVGESHNNVKLYYKL